MSKVTGLIVQGGAMRAIYSMAVLSTLQKHGVEFDHVFGASAGAMNAAYFVAKQSEDALSAYLNDINIRKFINPLRLNKIVNVDYLVDEIFKQRKPLSIKKLRSMITTLHIAVTDYKTGEPAFITNHDTGVDLFEALRATAAVPIYYGRPVNINNKRYIDGGITQNIPFQHALDVGCTDITVILTHPLDSRQNRLPKFIKRLLLFSYPTRTREAILNEPVCFQKEIELIKEHRRLRGPRVVVVAPSDPLLAVSFMQNMDQARLLKCVKMGEEDTLRAIIHRT